MFCLFLGGLFYSLENRFPARDFSQLRQDLEQHEVTELQIRGNMIEVTTTSGLRYTTHAPEPQLLLSRFDTAKLRINYREDFMLYYFQGGLFVFALLLGSVIWASLAMAKRQQQETEKRFARDKRIVPTLHGVQVRFKDVAGLPEAQEELQEVVTFLKHPELFAAVGATIPRGMLLQGPPGTGKTLLARAIAGETGVPFYSFSGSDFVEMFVGVGASRVRDLFIEAKKNAPCIVFIDEIDAVGSSRVAGSTDGNDERGQTLNALLVEMDGFSSTDNIIVLGATNRPDILDPALRRPGRFDRQITILPPDIKGRLAILRVHCQKVNLAPDVNLEEIAQFTSGFTGAELASLVNEAALLTVRKKMKAIDRSLFDLARDRIVLGVERKGMVITEKDKTILAHHEAGHAIVAKLLPESDPVHKITIIPRGQALGQTQQLPLGDRYAYGREYLKNRITILLGGRAAEQLIFNDQTTRAENDLVQATEIATNMICKWGMGESLGPQVYLVDQGGYLGGGNLRLAMSNATAGAIDREIKELLTSCYNQAMEILTNERVFLEALAEILLQSETIDKEEFEIIFECSLTKKKMKARHEDVETECAICPAKGQCLHY
jgi:cell division protease FtsH